MSKNFDTGVLAQCQLNIQLEEKNKWKEKWKEAM